MYSGRFTSPTVRGSPYSLSVIDASDIVRYGRPATEALARAIGRGKQAGPLHPVTVIVPTNFVGLSARRILGSGLVGLTGQGPTPLRGMANVSFVTPFRLAEQMSTGLLLDRVPLTNPALRAAVRRALATNPGQYHRVSEHEATEAALADLFSELSNVDEQGLESIEVEGKREGREVVSLFRSIQGHLGRFHTEKDLAEAAANRSDLPALVGRLGHVIWYLPAPVSPAMSQLIGRVLSDATSSDAIVALTGDPRADEPIVRICSDTGVYVAGTDIKPDCADEIVSVTDADEEVRAVVRMVLAQLRRGTRADRIGIFYPTPDPYVRILEQHFSEADIAANGPSRRRLADSVAGRTLLAALALPSQRWRRDRVMSLASGAPIRFRGKSAHPSAWESISRQAGVVRDLADWDQKLVNDSQASQKRLDQLVRTADETSSWQQQRLNDHIRDVQELDGFVKDLALAVGSVDQATTWPDKCEAAKRLLASLLGPENKHSFWPEVQQDGFNRVLDALTRLATLEQLEPKPTSAVFSRALRSELDVARSRNGSFGQGVVYGPLSSGIGHDLDTVFILGCVDGLLPVPRRDTAPLPDRLRGLSLNQLEPMAAHIHHQHREFLATLSAAPRGNRILTFPRGNLRSNGHSLPSRWLLDAASSLAGRVVHSTDFADLAERDGITVIPSYAAGIRELEPSTAADRALARIGRALDEGRSCLEHGLARRALPGLRMQLARDSNQLTAYDGNLSGLELPDIDQYLLSASRLETWATCGFRYFLAYVLDLAERDDPESVEQISAQDRGSLIHQVLELFMGEALELRNPTVPSPDRAWTEEDRTRLHQIATQVFREYEARGRTGRTVHWEVKKKDILGILDSFLVTDNEFRSTRGATPVRVELPFGLQEAEPLVIDLPNGRSLRFRGLADRVDVTVDGRAIVSDYKTGKADKYKQLNSDPVQEGRTLQLGLYGEVARRETGAQNVSSAYWLLEADPNKSRKGYDWTDNRRKRFIDVLTAITDGIAEGVFAAEPGEWDTYRQTNAACSYCDFDSVCLRARGDHRAAKAEAVELTARHRLVMDEAS